MTQPTTEQMVEWLHPFCKLDEQPSQSDLTAANMASAIIAALTAQAGDGNRLPLEEVPEGWRLEQLAFYHNSENQPKWICDLYNEKANRLVSTNCHDTSAEALRAAIAAAKGE